MKRLIYFMAVLLSVMGSGAHGSVKSQIKVAESYFNQLSSDKNMASSNISPGFSPDGFYYRSYSDALYGVNLYSNDSIIYKKVTGGQWIPVSVAHAAGGGVPLEVIGKNNGHFGSIILGEASSHDADIIDNRAILISKKYSKLSLAEKKIIASTYHSGYPVAILYPAGNDISNMSKDLGMPYSGAVSSGIELWGVRNENGVEVFQIDEKSGGERYVSLVDNKLGDLALASTFLEWIRGVPNGPAKKPLLQPNQVGSGLADLESLAAAQTNFTTYHIGKNIYSIRTDFWVAYSVPKDVYYIYAREKGTLNGGNEYKNFSSTRNPAGNYEINGLASVHEFWNTPGDQVGLQSVQPVDHLPLTTVNQVQTTSGISWSIGGSVDAGGPSLSAGVEVSSTTTYTSSDVETHDQSGRRFNDFNWHFTIREPENCGNCVPVVPSVAHNTFSPTMEWIWEVNGNLIREKYKTGYPVYQAYNTTLYDMVYKYRDWEYRRYRTATGPTTADKAGEANDIQDNIVIKMPR